MNQSEETISQQTEASTAVENSSSAADFQAQSPIAEAQTLENKTESASAKDFTREQEISKEVLEKLKLPERKDIQEPFSQAKINNEPFINKILEQVQNQKMDKLVAQDLLKIENFMKQGLINPVQGQNLKNLVLKKAFDKFLQNGLSKQNLSPALTQNSQNILDKTSVLNDFQRNNPDFFNQNGRKEILDYLKNDVKALGKDDIKKISSMVENLEKLAVERYLQKTAYEKTLQDSNAAAKQKLTANAQNSGYSEASSKSFTRKQIGNMSSAEFVKNEPFIMDQLRKGLIR